MRNSHLRNTLIIVIGGLALFLPFLGSVHLFDWDEINFAECAREMVVTGNYSEVQINFQPFWEKPPLFIWMQALSMNLFGVNEFAARFPNAICGVVSLLVIYNIGRRLYSEKFGMLWVLVYAGSFLTFFYFKTGIIDPWFNLFIFLGIFYAIEHTNNPVGKNAVRSAILAGAFIGLATLTKGPAGLLIFVLTAGVYAVIKRFRQITEFRYLLIFTVSFLVSGFGWFLVEIMRGNSEIVKEFIIYQIRLFNTKDSGHGGFLLYHFVVLLIGCFPASVFFLQSHRKSESDTPYQKHFKRWMIILFWVVLILFTIVKTKIVHYSSMCWLPLTFLSAYSVYKLMQGEFEIKKWVMRTGMMLGFLLGIIFTLLPLADILKPYIIDSGIIGDKFAVKNLEADGGWMGFEWIPGLIFLVFSLYLFITVSGGHKKRIPYVFAITIFSAFSISALIVPKVEKYTQGAAIEFYEYFKGKDVYLETAGFKSYAYLFYSDKQPEQNTPALLAFAKKRGEYEEKEGIMDPNTSFARYCVIFMEQPGIDKDAYLSIKFMDAENYLKSIPTYHRLYEKNGFVFLKRYADKK